MSEEYLSLFIMIWTFILGFALGYLAGKKDARS